jgi:epoxyqueuosine reductase
LLLDTPVTETNTLKHSVLEAARGAGFELAGVAPVGDFSDHRRFEQWIAAGRAGEMKYLESRDEAGGLKRGSLRRVAPWARSVIVCASNYNTAQPYSTEAAGPDKGWISRYAWSREDYHDSVMRRLRVVESHLQESCRAALGPGRSETRPHTNNTELLTRCYVDTGPIVERIYARHAGIGWIGKNTCVINQKLGSWLFLGVILTSLELEPDLPAPDRCGTCTRCIDACPTHAIVAPQELDANLCISYLTIEKRGNIAEALRSAMGRHVFGCDICQDVCPWNRKAPTTTAPEFQPREGLVNPALEWLAEMNAEEFRETFRASPIRRMKLAGLQRNAAIAMGNRGKRKFVPVLERLSRSADPVVSEVARWALTKLDQSARSGHARGPQSHE